jgi:hypothetical protein
MIHSDSDLFYGEWSGESGVVKYTEWEFERDHTLEIQIKRPHQPRSKEYYQWKIIDNHLHIINLPEDDEQFTDHNESAITFLRYTIPLTYTFNDETTSLIIGTDKSTLSEKFNRDSY